MTTINMYVNKIYPVTIGFSGENEVSEVVFDYSSWATLYGDGNLTLIIIRPKDDEPYPVDLTAGNDDHTAVWTVSETDTEYCGIGSAQLIYTVDDQVKKSAIFDLTINRSLPASTNPPDPYQTWLDLIIAAKNDAEDAVDDAEAEAENAEAWAVGQRNGVDVESTDETYHNNAKYYSDNAATVLASAAIGVGMTLTTANGILTITEE